MNLSIHKLLLTIAMQRPKAVECALLHRITDKLQQKILMSESIGSESLDRRRKAGVKFYEIVLLLPNE